MLASVNPLSMSEPVVSFLVPDISSPVLGPVTELARHLQPEFEVEIVGADFGHGICPLYRNAFPYRSIACHRIYRWPNYIWESQRLAAELKGNIIVSVKAFATSLPVALQVKRSRAAKVIAYLDEWDGALMARLTRIERAKRWLKHLHHPVDDVYCPWVERSLSKCDLVLSTTTALQRKFGGEVLPMGVDIEEFAPRPRPETDHLRKELHLEGRNLIVFGGVVRPHKGIELILEALSMIGDTRNALVIVGPRNEHVIALENTAQFAPYLVAIGPRLKSEMPKYLGLADLIVLPLNNDLLAQTQMPCKIFEAMAMAKPIIASDVSDLPQVLEGCGRIVPPHDAQPLAKAIRWVFSNPDEADNWGRLAREKCKQQYAKPVVVERLQAIVRSF